jgi:hypothetical protein
MGDEEPPPVRPLGYARPRREEGLTGRMGRFERTSVSVILGSIGVGFAYFGVLTLYDAQPMWQGSGERIQLMHTGWGLIGIGLMIGCFVGSTLRHRR